MAREETERTVIAMATTGDGWSDKRPAVAALERIAPIRFPFRFPDHAGRVIFALPDGDPPGTVQLVD